MLWAYVLLTVVTLPQDAVNLARIGAAGVHGWQLGDDVDAVELVTRVAFAAIVVLKGVLLLGMGMLHTRFHFVVKCFEGDGGGDAHAVEVKRQNAPIRSDQRISTYRPALPGP